ncbi:FAD-dependent oxidoreductase [Candidatus Uhrbacteria bacterium]|nr:FAD-dependent oxidoreductase [Candidatus Uhrbacteria bacterium]
MMQKRIAVVGAGISGLTCAWELQKAGHDVTVFEAADRVGGRMGTRLKDGFHFDTGTNFFIGQYTQTKKLGEELGVGDRWQPMVKGRHGLFRHGKIHWLSLEPKNFLSAYSFLSPVARIRFVLMAAIAYRKFPGTDFFDLSNCPPELDTTSAYDFALRWGGKEVADALIDGYNATYEFHSAKEMSVTGLVALLGLMLKDNEGFAMWHTTGGEMQVLPDALARKLTVRLQSPITFIRSTAKGIIVHTSLGYQGDKGTEDLQDAKGFESREAGQPYPLYPRYPRSLDTLDTPPQSYDAVVLATTADVTKKIYLNPTPPQRKLLDSVHYSSTITVSFRVPLERVKDLAIITVPHIESKIISSYSNESTKGTTVGDRTLVNVWIWEDYAPELLKKTDEEIFAIVGEELQRVCPPLQSLSFRPGSRNPETATWIPDQVGDDNRTVITPHDLERLPVSMPKYEHGYITKVAEFWKKGEAPQHAGQGDNNVWFCGDYLNAPWVEGSVRIGQRVARIIHGTI